MRNRKPLLRDEKGAALLEFAIIAPVFFGVIFAIAQLGMLFFASAGLGNAVAEGARLASLYPRPTDAQIVARITDKRFGLDPAHIVGPTIVDGTLDGASYAEITMRYNAPVSFVFVDVGPITLTKTRRVYTQPTS